MTTPDVRATLPGPPIARLTAPAPPTTRVALPGPPIATIDGHLIPVIHPYLVSAAAATGVLAAVVDFVRVRPRPAAGGVGSLEHSVLGWRATSTAAGTAGGASRAAVKVVGVAVVAAGGGAVGQVAARVAVRARPAFHAAGHGTAVLRPIATVQPIASGAGRLWGNVPQSPVAASVGGTTVHAAAVGAVVVASALGAVGETSAVTTLALALPAPIDAAGHLAVTVRAVVRMPLPVAADAQATVAASARVPFTPATAGEGVFSVYAVKGVALDAVFSGGGELSAPVRDGTYDKYPRLGAVGQTTMGQVDVALPVTTSGHGGVTVAVEPHVPYAVSIGSIGTTTAAVISRPVVVADFAGGSEVAAVTHLIKIGVTDPFSGGDGAIGPNYTAVGSNLVVASGRAQAGQPGSFNATVLYASRHNTALLTDDQEVVIDLVAPSPAGTADYSNTTGCFLRCDAAGTTRYEVAVSNSKLYVNSRVNNEVTVRAGSSGKTIPTPTQVRVTAIGSTYTVYINGVQQHQWVDSASSPFQPVGPSNRHFGLAAVGSDQIGSAKRGYGIDTVTARDL
ncbi:MULTISPECIES: hypothetical protein [unclassified Nocardia]|uniref:hypothetical protein n=1 Tax=unclassified Nocardia TaxID=2637762 RepID=UPI00278BCCA9|nr:MULTISPECIES: hypothetical protein [unclassified Nocardia]